MKIVAITVFTLLAFTSCACLSAMANPPAPPAAKGASATQPAPHVTPTRAPQSYSPGWTLDQKSQLCGDMQVTLTARGIKVRSTQGSLSMLCLAPFKEVTIYNESTKKYCVEPLETFRCPGNKTMAVVNGGLLRDVQVIKGADKPYQNHQVHTYVSTPAYIQKQQLRMNNHEIPGRAVKSLLIYTTDDFKTASRADLAVGRFYGLPAVSGFPLMVHYRDFTFEDHDIDNVKTTKMTACQIADNAFALPADLKKVLKQQEVFVGDATNDAIQMMVGQ